MPAERSTKRKKDPPINVPLRRSSRPRKVVSHKGTCGAPAARIILGNNAPQAVTEAKVVIPVTPVVVHAAQPSSIKFREESGTENYVEVTIRGKPMVDETWCSGCRNGGTLYTCRECEYRAFCQDCLDINDGNFECFVCPVCFLSTAEAKANKDGNPYTSYRMLRNATTRENYPKVIVEPVAIISINLIGWAVYDSPGLSAYQALLPWLKGNVAFIEMDYDFRDNPSIENFKTRMDDLVNELLNGRLMRFRRFSVFINTHSDPITGDLHIGPNNYGSARITDLLPLFFPDNFRALLKQSKDNILNLMACGSVSTVPQSNADVQAFAKLGFFLRILAFTQANFQPSLSNHFCQRVTINFMIFQRFSLVPALQDSQGLGAHTGIIEFHGPDTGNKKHSKPMLYTWSHPGKAPSGHRITLQCAMCKCIDSIKVSKVSKNSRCVTRRCTFPNCTFEEDYHLPEGAEWVSQAPSKSDSNGAWFREVYTAVF